MTKDIARILIACAGGNKKFGIRLGIDSEPRVAARINQWRHRGIPSSVQIEKRQMLSAIMATARRRGLL